MSLTAVVVAGERGGCVDTLTPVGGVPMLVCAVRALLATGLFDEVVLLDRHARRAAVLDACAGLPVVVRDPSHRAPMFPRTPSSPRPRAGRRVGTRAGDAPASPDLVLLHDAARPLAPAALALSVVDAAGSGCDVAVPVLPLADTVKQVDGAGIVRASPDRAGLRAVQTPQALRGELLRGDIDPLGCAVTHAAAGGAVHTVAGDPLAFAVRTAWDLELAELLVAGGGR